MNLNDPDGFIWIPIYLVVAFLPLKKNVSIQYLKIGAIVILILGSLSALGLFTTIMPSQVDGRLLCLGEHQREGLGLILGAMWLWFGQKLLSR